MVSYEEARDVLTLVPGRFITRLVVAGLTVSAAVISTVFLVLVLLLIVGLTATIGMIPRSDLNIGVLIPRRRGDLTIRRILVTREERSNAARE